MTSTEQTEKSSLQSPEISLLPSQEERAKAFADLLRHPLNRTAQRHMEALKIDLLPNWMPILLLAQWSLLNQPDQCTQCPITEAEIALVDWTFSPRTALSLVEENTRLDDFAQMEPQDAATYLMLSLTAPAHDPDLD